MSTTPATPSGKDRALRAVAVLGLIAILVLGAWGIIQIAFTLFGFLGNTDSNTPAATNNGVKQEQVVVTVPSSLTSGTAFNLSFTHQNAEGNYAYEVVYSCASGVTVEASLPTGKMQAVPCNTPFNYIGATATMPLTAKSTATSPVPVTFTVGARNLATGLVKASGIANTTVAPAAGTTATKPTTTAAKPSTTYVSSGSTSNLYGTGDLAVSMGSVTGSSGRYSVTFTIQNSGTNTIPAGWTFNAALPAAANYTYNGTAQQALRPGDKIVYTLSFTMQNYGYGYSSGYGYYTSTTYNPYHSPNCGYTNSYTYNGSYSYPTAQYNCNNNSTYAYPSYYNTSPYNYPYSYGSVTVTVDPYNQVQETTEVNNTATISVQ